MRLLVRLEALGVDVAREMDGQHGNPHNGTLNFHLWRNQEDHSHSARGMRANEEFTLC